MIVYISGKITGDEHYREKFADAETVLCNLGYTVLNPARLQGELAYEQYMLLGLAMVDVCDMVAMLPNWRDSPGATREWQYAKDMGKRTEDYRQIVKNAIKEMKGKAI